MDMVKKSSTPHSKKTAAKVDYYPNRMGLAVAAAAAVILVVLGVIAYYN
jgi:hypothetical protein